MRRWTTQCPQGGDCGGTGWVWVWPSDGPNPEPGGYVPCRCNPHRAGSPDELLAYRRDEFGDWVGEPSITARATTMSMDADDAPF